MSRTTALPILRTLRKGTGTWTLIALALAARRQRRALAKLSPELLKDVGISAAEAHREVERPAWDVPAHWLR